MNPRVRGVLRALTLLAVGAVLIALFPKAMAATEMAARELRYLWWLILMILLGVWLVWGFRRRP